MDTNPNIQIKKGNLRLDYKYFVFSGGEISVKLDTSNLLFFYDKSPYTIVARIQNANDAMAIAFIKDAIQQWDGTNPTINLFMPYIPYARQDRVCDKGESFSLKVFGDYINSLGFDKVRVVDPHSDVTKAVFDNLEIVTQLDVISGWRELSNCIGKTILVSPDAGSVKKISDIAKYFSHSKVIRADKLRDLATGQIKETIVYCEDLQGQDVTVCDDICDGGFTFTELAKELRKKNAGRIHLYVTHGIFSKGFQLLFKSGISEIWTTDSFSNTISNIHDTHVLNLADIIKL